MNLADLGVAEVVRATSSGDIAVGQVVEDCLARIAERDGELNAFSVVLAEQARADAVRLDADWAPEGLGPLFGVPLAIKEEIDVAGCVTTFGGRANSTPARVDSELVRRLRAAGAVIIGKTTMPEFGQWPFTESVAMGVTRNPWDRRMTPGVPVAVRRWPWPPAWFPRRSVVTVADRFASLPHVSASSVSNPNVAASAARR